MSLINQMLSDLDQRQAVNNDSASNNADHDSPQIATIFPVGNNRPRRPYLKYSFYFVVVSLLSAITWFSYSIYTQTSYARTSKSIESNSVTEEKQQAVKPVVRTEQKRKKIVYVKQVPQKTAKEVKLLPKNEPGINSVIAAVPQSQVEQTETSTALTENTFVADEQESAAVNEDDLSRDIRAVHKQNRKLTPRQLAEVTYKKGYQLLNQNKIYSAEAKLLLALEHDPKHVKAREMLAALYLRLGRKVEAEEILTKGLLYLPGYSNFAKLQARLLIDNNKIARAVKVLLQHKPNISSDPDYYALLAASYQRQKKHAAAANVYVKLLKIKPREGIWWVGMAISLEALGKTKQAREAYEKARQTGTLNSRFSNYSSQRLKLLQPVGDQEY